MERAAHLAHKSTGTPQPAALYAVAQAAREERSETRWLEDAYVSWVERISGDPDTEWAALSRRFATPLV